MEPLDDYNGQRAELLESIEHDSRQVRVALHELTDAAGHGLDVGEHIRTSPVVWAAGAFLVGAWLAGRAPSNDAGATTGHVRGRRSRR